MKVLISMIFHKAWNFKKRDIRLVYQDKENRGAYMIADIVNI